MANLFLDSGEIFNIGTNLNTRVFGQSGNEVVVIESGATGIIVDQNIERIDLSSNSSDYTYQQQGNQLLVSTGGILIATIPVQGDADGTQVVFANGSVSVILSAGVMTLGNAVVSSTSSSVTPNIIDSSITTLATPSPGGISNVSQTINITTASTILDASGSNVTFNVTSGSYIQQIKNFSAGDILSFPSTDIPTVVNTSFTDGAVDIIFTNAGQTVEIKLTGISAANDQLLTSIADFDTVFGVGTIISLQSPPPGDTTAPAITTAPSAIFNYNENQVLNAPIATITATDDVAVTGFSITTGDTNGLFEIDNVGNISISSAGIFSAANDFEIEPNSFTLEINASDAAGNISSPVSVILEIGDIITEGSNGNLSGGDGNDTLVGDDSNNFIGGGAGNDTIIAGGGQDNILAGPGQDHINLTETIAAGDSVDSREGDGFVAVGGVFTTPDIVIGFNADFDVIRVSSAETSIILNGTPVIPSGTIDFSNIAQNGFDANGTVGGAFITGTTASLTNEADVIAAIGTIANETAGEEAYFAIANTNGSEFGVYHFVSSTPDDAVTAGELEILGQVTFTGVLDNTDFAVTTV